MVSIYNKFSNFHDYPSAGGVHRTWKMFATASDMTYMCTFTLCNELSSLNHWLWLFIRPFHWIPLCNMSSPGGVDRGEVARGGERDSHNKRKQQYNSILKSVTNPIRSS